MLVSPTNGTEEIANPVMLVSPTDGTAVILVSPTEAITFPNCSYVSLSISSTLGFSEHFFLRTFN